MIQDVDAIRLRQALFSTARPRATDKHFLRRINYKRIHFSSSLPPFELKAPRQYIHTPSSETHASRS
jgi:hypothetical protein